MTLEELHQTELALSEKETVLTRQCQELHQIQDLYDTHIYEGQRFLGDLRYHFHQNDCNSFFEAVENSLLAEYQGIRSDLEENEEVLRIEKLKVSTELEDVLYTKKD